MNSLNRSISVYPRLQSLLLRLCSSPSTTIMTRPLSHRRAISSGDDTSETPKKRSFSSEGYDYDEQFPPLNGSNRNGKGSRPSMVDLGSTTLSTPSTSSQFQNSASGKDALSLQRNVGYKNRDQGPRGRPVLPHEIYVRVDKRNDTCVEEEANGLAVEAGFGTGSGFKHNRNSSRRNYLDRTNVSSSNKRSQSQTRSLKKHRNSGGKNRDQSSKRIQELPFDICSSVHKRNDRCIADQSTEEEAGGEETEQTVEVSIKHRVLKPGMVLLKHYLTHDAQVDIINTCRDLGLKKPQGFYQPGYSAGSKLRLQMMCLGRNWDPQTKYSKNTEKDSEPPNIPETFSLLVLEAIREAHALIDSEEAERELPMMSPDICIVNFYSETGRLGLHQDRDESRESIKKGLPIVSFSIGDSAEFLYGEERDVEKAEQVKLESGDVLIFGGESRMIFHGVKSIIPNSAPISLLDHSSLRTGRLNLTFRRF